MGVRKSHAPGLLHTRPALPVIIESDRYDTSPVEQLIFYHGDFIGFWYFLQKIFSGEEDRLPPFIPVRVIGNAHGHGPIDATYIPNTVGNTRK
jgi:hypothetical protein